MYTLPVSLPTKPPVILPNSLVKLKKLVKKPPENPWKLFVDTTTTAKYLIQGEDYDPRDLSGGLTDWSDEDEKKLDYATRRLHKVDCGCGDIVTPGYLAWDREYIGDNIIQFIYYFSTPETAFEYYMTMKDESVNYPLPDFVDKTLFESNIKIWYLTDVEDVIIRWPK